MGKYSQDIKKNKFAWFPKLARHKKELIQLMAQNSLTEERTNPTDEQKEHVTHFGVLEVSCVAQKA